MRVVHGLDDELITRGERRRRRSVEQKREIAAESLEPGVSSITVARRYGISSGLLYTWRRHLLEGSLGSDPLCYAGVFVYKGPPQICPKTHAKGPFRWPLPLESVHNGNCPSVISHLCYFLVALRGTRSNTAPPHRRRCCRGRSYAGGAP